MVNIDDIKFSLVNDSKGAVNVTHDGNKYIFNYPCDFSVDCTPYLVKFPPGVYRFSLWGAEGGNSRKLNSPDMKDHAGGKGAFVSGEISLRTDTILYLYVGGKGEDLTGREKNVFGRGGYNGGGKGGYDIDEEDGESGAGGGGSSDIRILCENSIESLKSRIIVAGAGGGSVASDKAETLTDKDGNKYRHSPFGGNAGTLEGFSNSDLAYPGTQKTGKFGFGIDGWNIGTNITKTGGSFGGAGSGYYGGSAEDLEKLPSFDYYKTGGAGGSSFVSGCRDCNAVSRNPKDEVEHTNKRTHFSGYKFSKIVMKSGNEAFLSPNGKEETGHFGNGAISIEFISNVLPFSCASKRQRVNVLILMFAISVSK